MRYSTTCPSQFAWQYEWLWFNIGVLRAEYAHRSNLSKPDILQTSVWLNDIKKAAENYGANQTTKPIPLPQPMHTEYSQRVFRSHSLPLQFYFYSSLIYINVFFFWSYFSFSFCLSPRINMRIGNFFFLLLAFVCDNCPRSSCSTNMCLVPILCVCRAHNNFFFRHRRHRHRVRLFVFYVSCAAVLSI